MSDVLQLEEQLVGVLVLAAAEFAAIVAEHVVDDGPMLLKGRQARVVEGLHRGDRQLGGAEPCPGVAGVAGDHGLQVDLADAFQHPDEAGVDRQSPMLSTLSDGSPKRLDERSPLGPLS